MAGSEHPSMAAPLRSRSVILGGEGWPAGNSSTAKVGQTKQPYKKALFGPLVISGG